MTTSRLATKTMNRTTDGSDKHGFIPKPSSEFVATPAVESVSDRALAYLECDYPVHLAGPPGTGKTTLAMHLAALRGRRTVIVHGNQDLDSSDFVGSNQGYKKSKVVDNFIHSVVKKEEEMQTMWSDHRLATACRHGYTLIYDEFNRSSPETNNILLSVFEEGLLSSLGSPGSGSIEVHPEFRAIFTSNPAESVGTHETQDALRDRLLTIHLDFPCQEAEFSIVTAQSSCSAEVAERLVEVVRRLRERSEGVAWPTLRATVTLGDIFAGPGAENRETEFVRAVCHDVLTPSGLTPKRRRKWSGEIDAAVRATASDPARRSGSKSDEGMEQAYRELRELIHEQFETSDNDEETS
jgi:gas vesicle protein GvpN